MKKWNRILSLLLALVLVIGIVPVSAMAKVAEEPAVQADAEPDDLYNGPLSGELQAIRENWPQQAGETVAVSSASGEGLSVTPVADPQLDVKEAVNEQQDLYVTPYEANEVVRVMVVMEDPSLLEQGYSKSEIASNSTAVASEVRAMEAKQDDVVAEIQSIVDEMEPAVSLFSLDDPEPVEVEVNYHYSVALNGVSVEMPYGALEEVRSLNGVVSAFVVPTYSVPEDMSDSADPNTYATKNSFGSALTWEELGYTGAGMRIAVIDTGLDSDHPSFAAAPAEPSLTEAEIAGVLENLNAYERYSEKSAVKLTAANLYRTEKIAYGFNYVDNDLDITHNNDLQGDHGTHVAGIAAANKVEGADVVGVAPDAQLMIMKVFGKAGGAYFDDIVAALEDCFWLDADAVNLSLGSPAGFTISDESSDEFNKWSDEVYARIEESDMIASISAGNSGSAAAGNGLGTDRNLAADPDNGIISSPATYPGATVVASIENESVMCNYLLVDGQQVPFNDVGALSFTNLAGTHEYVMVPGYGTADDFAQVDVSGKIAVVSRGELAFTDKQTNAHDAGAIGCLVYDNVEGDLINMQDAGIIPSAFVSKASGELLANGSGTLEVRPAEERMTIPSSLAGQMSDFSSWGVTPDLQLIPDVTAPGGNIYSTLDGGIYGTMSGTSMSAPHITGMAALVLQYLHDVYPNQSDSWYHTVAEALIMSTAEPVVEPTGVLYSPRKQGAGSANVYRAVSSPAYLTVDGSSPKVSFGDDDQKTGVYHFSFEINNLSDESASYALSGSALTDQVDVIGNLLYLMGETSRNLDAEVTFSVGGVEIDGENVSAAGKLPYDADSDGDVDLDDVQYMLDSVNGLNPALPELFDINLDGKQDTADAQALYELLRVMPATGDGVVTVPAGETVTVDVTVTLSAADKAYMDQYYQNGIYVEGFVRCYAIGGTNDLSLPFMGFYGDWSAARIFDDTAWYYLDNPTVNRYYNVLWTEDGQWILGDNPYLYETYDPGHNVLSPNGDGYQEAISQMYLGMMRNAKKLTFTWTDENGNELMQTSADYIRKSYYVSAYGICYPFIYSGYVEDYYDFLNEDGTCAHEDLERLTLTVEGYLDDGDDLVDDSFVVPLVIDTTAPVLDVENMAYNTTADGGRELVFNVSDNYDIAAVVTLTLAGDVIEAIPVTTKQEGVDGEEDTITLDVSKYDADFYVVVCDYGYNESYYQVSFSGKHNVDGDAFYGYRRTCVVPYNGYLYITDAYSGWHSFTDPADLLMHTSLYSMGETAVSAADYVDGYVIGIDDLGSIFAMASGTWTRNEFGTMGDYPQALDMAYDFSSETMYVLTDEHAEGEGGYLLTLDIRTGALTEVGKVTGINSASAQGVTLACDNEGVLYTIDYSTGDLYTLNKNTAEATRVGATGYTPVYMQSMTVDHSTDTLYWAAYQNYDGTSSFYEVDKATGALTKVDDTELNSQLTALFKPYVTSEDLIPDEADLTGLKLSAESLSMAVGNEIALTCQPIPYYAELGDVTWTSSDPAVAAVENGLVTGVGEGEAVITASAQGKSVTCSVKVTPIQADLVSYDAGDSYMWLNYDAAEPQNAVTLDDAKQPNGYYSYFTCAAYADGAVYAYDTAGGFYQLDAETMQGVRLGTNNNVNGMSGMMLALAFNYADGYLYGIAETGSFWSMDFDLVRVNPASGEFEVVDRFDTESYGQPMNLAVDLDGNFYSVIAAFDYDTWETTIKLVSFQLEDGKIANISADLTVEGAEAGYGNYNSLVYSYENEGLFWADEFGHLLWIDPATGETVTLGEIGETAYAYSPTNVCLFERPKNDPDVSYAKPETVTMQESFLLLEGSSVPTNVTVEPWNAKATLNYSIADEDIATVDSTGVITGLKAGRTSLQVLISETGEALTANVTVAKSAGNLYGSVVTDFLYTSNIWVQFPDATPGDAEMIHDSYYEDFQPFAGAYYDGSLYAYSQDQWGDLNYKNYLLKYDLVDYSAEIIGQVHENIRDMEFDYTTGTMFAIVEDGKAVCALAQVNLETAEIAIVGDTGFKMAAMTVDKNGTIYAVSETGNLYTLNKSTGEAKLVGSTGVTMNGGNLYQSMHCDLDTGNVYWAQAARDYTNGLYLVDTRTGTATNLGTVGTGAEVACLYTVPETEPTIPAVVLPTGVSLNEKAALAVGDNVRLNATVLPFSVASVDQTLTWSSSDESVAIVDNGVVTGVSAGTAVITATTANGKSASCLVTVTEEARRFYAYDETNYQWISFSGTDTTDVTVERADEGDEARIMASVYVDDQLYSFTDDGLFWSIDPETFERTYVGEGVSNLTIEATVYDWWFGGSYTVDVPVTPYDLSYDEATGMTYGLFMAEDYDNWVFVTVIGEVDLETGKVNVILQSEDIQPGNLLVKNGRAFFVDTYYSGILKYVDLYAETPEATDIALVYNYWGDFTGGRSFLEDPLTGTIYVIRDNSGGESSLWTISLGDADVQSLGLIGTEGIVANSLFIK